MANGPSISATSHDNRELAAAPANAQPAQELYLEVRVNQGSAAKLSRFMLSGERLAASAATLRELGLRLPLDIAEDDVAVDLALLPGISMNYDAANQRLSLQVPANMLDRPTTHLSLTAAPAMPAVSNSSPGLLLNYDVYVQQQDSLHSASGVTELRMFGLGAGIWSSTQSTRLQGGNGDWRGSNTRLDSRWQLDLPGPMLSLSIGDNITGALQWSRAARIGGLHLSRSFALQPYRVTTPLASFTGVATLPSTVDLYINGVRQGSRDVQPGRFQLDSAVSLNGSGQAQLVVTDINGQTRTLEFPLYGTPTLLQTGLTDWSLDMGVLREDYALRSFKYAGRPMASASLRHGLHEQLTLEAHAEFGKRLQVVGIGAVVRLGERAGIFNSSVTRSHTGALQGQMQTLGYQWSARGFSLSASTVRRSVGFRDAPAFIANVPLPRRTDQFFMGLGNTHSGQFGFSYISQHYPNNPSAHLAGLSWSRALPGNVWLSAQLLRDLGRPTTDSVNLYFSMPLGRQTQLSSSSRQGTDGHALTLEANRSLPTDASGWGWRAQAYLDTRPSAIAELSHLGDTGQWRIGIDYNTATDAVAYADASGALAWLGGGMHALRRVDDAFAMVSTSGVAQVPVRLENRLIGATDAHGQLLVAPLRAWQRNLISIDTLGLPMDMHVGSPQQQVVPASGTAAKVNFKLQSSHPVRLQLRAADGEWLASGSAVTVTLGELTIATTIVGHEGQVYLQDPPADASLLIEVGAGRRCVLALPAAPPEPRSSYATTLQCPP